MRGSVWCGAGALLAFACTGRKTMMKGSFNMDTKTELLKYILRGINKMINESDPRYGQSSLCPLRDGFMKRLERKFNKHVITKKTKKKSEPCYIYTAKGTFRCKRKCPYQNPTIEETNFCKLTKKDLGVGKDSRPVLCIKLRSELRG
jgi:hypothetical protein